MKKNLKAFDVCSANRTGPGVLEAGLRGRGGAGVLVADLEPRISRCRGLVTSIYCWIGGGASRLGGA